MVRLPSIDYVDRKREPKAQKTPWFDILSQVEKSDKILVDEHTPILTVEKLAALPKNARGEPDKIQRQLDYIELTAFSQQQVYDMERTAETQLKLYAPYYSCLWNVKGPTEAMNASLAVTNTIRANPMTITTSAGYLGYVFNKPLKKNWINLDTASGQRTFKTDDMSRFLSRLVVRYKDFIMEGKTPLTVLTYAPKIEALPEDAAREGKIRLFSCASIELTILERCFFLDIATKIVNSDGCIRSGWNEVIDLGKKHHELSKVYPYCVGLDFKRFDKQVRTYEVYLALWVLCSFNRLWTPDEVNRYAKAFTMMYCKSPCQLKSDMFIINGTLPSGIFLTNILGSLIVGQRVLRAYKALLVRYNALKPGWEYNITTLQCGDDLTIYVNESGLVPLGELLKTIQDGGCLVTDTNKTLVEDFGKLRWRRCVEGNEFISRHIYFNDRFQQYWAPLKRSSLLTYLYYTSTFGVANIENTILFTITEARALPSREEYDKIMRLLHVVIYANYSQCGHLADKIRVPYEEAQRQHAIFYLTGKNPLLGHSLARQQGVIVNALQASMEQGSFTTEELIAIHEYTFEVVKLIFACLAIPIARKFLLKYGLEAPISDAEWLYSDYERVKGGCGTVVFVHPEGVDRTQLVGDVADMYYGVHGKSEASRLRKLCAIDYHLLRPYYVNDRTERDGTVARIATSITNTWSKLITRLRLHPLSSVPKHWLNREVTAFVRKIASNTFEKETAVLVGLTMDEVIRKNVRFNKKIRLSEFDRSYSNGLSDIFRQCEAQTYVPKKTDLLFPTFPDGLPACIPVRGKGAAFSKAHNFSPADIFSAVCHLPVKPYPLDTIRIMHAHYSIPHARKHLLKTGADLPSFHERAYSPVVTYTCGGCNVNINTTYATWREDVKKFINEKAIFMPGKDWQKIKRPQSITLSPRTESWYMEPLSGNASIVILDVENELRTRTFLRRTACPDWDLLHTSYTFKEYLDVWQAEFAKISIYRPATYQKSTFGHLSPKRVDYPGLKYLNHDYENTDLPASVEEYANQCHYILEGGETLAIDQEGGKYESLCNEMIRKKPKNIKIVESMHMLLGRHCGKFVFTDGPFSRDVSVVGTSRELAFKHLWAMISDIFEPNARTCVAPPEFVDVQTRLQTIKEKADRKVNYGASSSSSIFSLTQTKWSECDVEFRPDSAVTDYVTLLYTDGQPHFHAMRLDQTWYGCYSKHTRIKDTFQEHYDLITPATVREEVWKAPKRVRASNPVVFESLKAFSLNTSFGEQGTESSGGPPPAMGTVPVQSMPVIGNSAVPPEMSQISPPNSGIVAIDTSQIPYAVGLEDARKSRVWDEDVVVPANTAAGTILKSLDITLGSIHPVFQLYNTIHNIVGGGIIVSIKISGVTNMTAGFRILQKSRYKDTDGSATWCTETESNFLNYCVTNFSDLVGTMPEAHFFIPITAHSLYPARQMFTFVDSDVMTTPHLRYDIINKTTPGSGFIPTLTSSAAMVIQTAVSLGYMQGKEFVPTIHWSQYKASPVSVTPAPSGKQLTGRSIGSFGETKMNFHIYGRKSPLKARKPTLEQISEDNLSFAGPAYHPTATAADQNKNYLRVAVVPTLVTKFDAEGGNEIRQLVPCVGDAFFTNEFGFFYAGSWTNKYDRKPRTVDYKNWPNTRPEIFVDSVESYERGSTKLVLYQDDKDHYIDVDYCHMTRNLSFRTGVDTWYFTPKSANTPDAQSSASYRGWIDLWLEKQFRHQLTPGNVNVTTRDPDPDGEPQYTLLNPTLSKETTGIAGSFGYSMVVDSVEYEFQDQTMRDMRACSFNSIIATTFTPGVISSQYGANYHSGFQWAVMDAMEDNGWERARLTVGDPIVADSFIVILVEKDQHGTYTWNTRSTQGYKALLEVDNWIVREFVQIADIGIWPAVYTDDWYSLASDATNNILKASTHPKSALERHRAVKSGIYIPKRLALDPAVEQAAIAGGMIGGGILQGIGSGLAAWGGWKAQEELLKQNFAYKTDLIKTFGEVTRQNMRLANDLRTEQFGLRVNFINQYQLNSGAARLGTGPTIHEIEDGMTPSSGAVARPAASVDPGWNSTVTDDGSGSGEGSRNFHPSENTSDIGTGTAAPTGDSVTGNIPEPGIVQPSTSNEANATPPTAPNTSGASGTENAINITNSGTGASVTSSGLAKSLESRIKIGESGSGASITFGSGFPALGNKIASSGDIPAASSAAFNPINHRGENRMSYAAATAEVVP